MLFDEVGTCANLPDHSLQQFRVASVRLRRRAWRRKLSRLCFCSLGGEAQLQQLQSSSLQRLLPLNQAFRTQPFSQTNFSAVGRQFTCRRAALRGDATPRAMDLAECEAERDTTKTKIILLSIGINCKRGSRSRQSAFRPSNKASDGRI